MPEDLGAAGAPQGLSWSWELDFAALRAAITGINPSTTGMAADDDGTVPSSDGRGDLPDTPGLAHQGPDGPEPGEGSGPEDADGEGRLPGWVLTGRVSERLAPGPDMAAWLAMAPVAQLAGDDLAAVAGSWRRLAAWAQAGELAAVAQIAARAAARDKDIGTAPDGRPRQVVPSAAAEVALELTMSRYSACWWTDLAVTLQWRLAATGRALATGALDLHRARLIAEVTGVLSDEAARAVEAKVLPAAGNQTTGMLRAALRRAVIAADPAGAEERRKDAERRARVVLYPDDETTATLAGQNMPAVHAAAAMARISAMARAMKAAGAGGGMDLLRAQVFAGLLLGTLPLVPPPEAAPPDGPPPDHPPGGTPPGWPDGDLGAPDDEVPPPGDADAPRDDDGARIGDSRAGHGEDWPGQHDDDADDRWPAGPWPELPDLSPVLLPALARSAGWRPAAGLLDLSLPWRVLAGLSARPGHLGRIGPLGAAQARRLAECATADPAAQWRIIVTTSHGTALAVARIPRPRHGPAGQDEPPPPGAAPGMGLVGRVTVTIPADILACPPLLPAARAGPGRLGPDPPDRILGLALRAAERAAARARSDAAADAAAGGCAHTAASPGYRPPPRLYDYITARDLTCRNPVCRQPAWRGDLDHTVPHGDGGLTCSCNLGGLCRADHLLKQHPDWRLEQAAPGIFGWTTPSGRTHTVTPETHPL